MKTEFAHEMSPRVKKLYDQLINRALNDRSEEWFTPEMFQNVIEDKDPNERFPLWDPIEKCSVIVRRALAINRMLIAMTDEQNSRKTHTAEIADGDLLLGNMPMGSNGLGKMFPRFLTEDELRAGSITNRNAASLFGHNTMNYEELLRDGLQAKINDCIKKLDQLAPTINKMKEEEAEARKVYEDIKNKVPKENTERKNALRTLREKDTELISQKRKFDFYWAVKLSCKAVLDYAQRFAVLAEKKAAQYPDGTKEQTELLELARIARKVPAQPAETFHEAMQSICFFHIALHASMNFISLGRLDQVLNPYLQKETDKEKALEIFECFILKCAARLNLTSNFLIKQDHVDYATVLGTHPYYIDQKAGVNNFLQNIIVGGKKADGSDATNECTYFILQAIENVNLPAPGIYVRIHKNSPKELINKIARSLFRTRNNPSVLNDEVMIPALYHALMQDEKNVPEVQKNMMELANDYCVDGCWEPILNGKSDWTFTMLVGLQAVESALNQGASLKKDEALFRGAKVSPTTPVPKSFDDLMKYTEQHLQFFVDQAVMSLFMYYMIDENAAPSPLFSAYLEGCMEKGADKASGGANHNLAGVVLGAVPDMVNELAAIQLWVFEKKKYSLEQVCEAIRENFGVDNNNLSPEKLELYKSIQVDFDTNSPKFGDNDVDADRITCDILDMFYRCVEKSASFGKKLFQDEAPEREWRRIASLRALAGYYGLPLGMTFNIKMKITAGFGTFEQYNWQGRSAAASPNRLTGMPIAPNFSPVPGTTHAGIMGVINSLSKFRLERFAAGTITDICLEEDNTTPEIISEILWDFIRKYGAMMTIAVGSSEKYKEIYEAVKESMNMDGAKAAQKLAPYANINVRIGGWQTPFITLPLDHMENYIKRPVEK
ncbi:MAG TPA: pyruvate formate lyase family protein [Bacteroides mediterraneensis]|uniref:pyruvate formate lyase family protein n=1 Tax=Bacteroides mediterraneensis TaxID=1841856 RepID=UPI0026ECE1EF|nr:pyruvate formate lyase family protein [Bacteroides mediterraneensis]HJH64100.1 pyruvate formate lyase family protein [Bacteroides mediterraneensis]